MNDWNWIEASKEDFEKNRFASTYYRIYHIEDDDKEVNDYKFWADSDDIALIILGNYKDDHMDGKEYYYSSSGYFCDSTGKRYDTMREMHEDYMNKPYDDGDREYDTDQIVKFKNDALSDHRKEILFSIKNKLREIEEKIRYYEDESEHICKAIEFTDLAKIDEQSITNIKDATFELDDKYSELKEIEYMLKTRHNINETWSLYTHILDDIRYNVPKMIEEDRGYPSQLLRNAADELGIEINQYGNAKTAEEDDKVRDKANEMWKNMLNVLVDHVHAYLYFSNYGIVDDEDAEMVEYDKIHSSEIPYKTGTYREIDYIKNGELVIHHWNAIWDWIKEYGESLFT
jgi:hypothetical protein